MKADHRAAPLFGGLVAVTIALEVIAEWTGADWVDLPVLACICAMVVFLALAARPVGWAFLIACFALTIGVLIWVDEWQPVLGRAVGSVAFLASFFSALTILNNVARASPAMTRAGTLLAEQPPGRRYLSLTFGTQVFALILNFGAIQLLGTLALASSRQEPDERIRKIRVRRMLLAIQRGFLSGVTWSPMSFSTALAVATIPGVSWFAIAMPGLVSSAILLVTGWALDRMVKLRIGVPPRTKTGSEIPWSALLPLGLLLLVILLPVLLVEVLLGIRVVGIVIVVVPLISIGWMFIQTGGARATRARLVTYLREELPTYRNDLLLIMSAGYLGIVGAALLVPVMERVGLDLGVMPSWALLLVLVIFLPVMGQIGANPILTISLVAPLLPSAAEVGLAPSAYAVALLCGWAMTGLTSPFTATNLLIGRFGEIPTHHVGWVWNRSYFLVVFVLLSIWTFIYAYLVS